MDIIVQKPSINPVVARIIIALHQTHALLRPNERVRIPVIRDLRFVLELSLREAKDLVDIVLDERDIESTVYGGPQ